MKEVTASIRFRPYISDSLPKNIPPRNIPSENAAKAIPTHCSESQNPRTIKGSEGMMIPKPTMSKKTVARIMGREYFFKVMGRKENGKRETKT